MSPSSTQICRAGLGVLLVLQLVMLAALFTQTPPHPPLSTPLFGLGPFLGTSISAIVAALMLGANTNRTGQIAVLVAALLALVSFGPQKWFDPAIGGIWPAVLLGEAAILAVVLSCLGGLRHTVADEGGV